jgi:hypothetical protein
MFEDPKTGGWKHEVISIEGRPRDRVSQPAQPGKYLDWSWADAAVVGCTDQRRESKEGRFPGLILRAWLARQTETRKAIAAKSTPQARSNRMLMMTARCAVSSGSWGSFDTGSAARSEREPRPTREGRPGAAQGGVALSRWPRAAHSGGAP